MTSTAAQSTSAQAIEARLHEMGDAEHARFAAGYFRTGPGEYGHGDRFLGIRGRISTTFEESVSPQRAVLAPEVEQRIGIAIAHHDPLHAPDDDAVVPTRVGLVQRADEGD